MGGGGKNEGSEDGWTPLFMAAQNGHEKCVELLLAKGAAMDQANNAGATPLHVASLQDHAEVVRLLLRAVVDHQQQSSIAAGRPEQELAAQEFAHGRTESEEESTVRCAFVNARAYGALGLTPLMLVRGRQHAGAGATAALLLEAGADADMEPTMPPGATALIGGFFTVGLPDLQVANGSVYYEITLLRLGDAPQVGWVPSGWAAKDGCGVGDDELSLGYDGVRHKVWRGDKFDTADSYVHWEEGMTVGFAIKLPVAGEGVYRCEGRT